MTPMAACRNCRRSMPPPSTTASGCSGQAAQSGDASANTIKIGILGPHTGEYAAYGLGVRNGAELYFNKVNENGGINGKRIELVIYDNKGDDTESVTAFTRMVDNGIPLRRTARYIQTCSAPAL